ncbi:MAG: GNAT family N-acetyltransferase [Bdellovibrionaceae bacterium]|nr:GNAT family N-acetyltransferase [Pseudobdellovibrionaceae bacterium]
MKMKTFELITYDANYKNAFKVLNLRWIEKYFRIESKDIEQTDNPEQCLAEGGEIFFVVEEGCAVGTCAMYKVGELKYELAKMAVDPEKHGKGYGDLLMKESEGWARRQNAKEILILSNTVLVPAIALYKKHGFQTIHLGAHPDYERCNIEMTKTL